MTAIRIGRNGRAWVAPVGTALPETVSDELNGAFVDLGEVSEEGLEHVFSVETGELRNWQGNAVANTVTSADATFKLRFYESIQSVVEVFYGQELASGTGTSSIKIGKPEDTEYALYIGVYTGDPTDEATSIKGYALARVAVGDRESVEEKGDNAGYGITFKALHDDTVGGFGYVLFDEDLADIS